MAEDIQVTPAERLDDIMARVHRGLVHGGVTPPRQTWQECNDNLCKEGQTLLTDLRGEGVSE